MRHPSRLAALLVVLVAACGGDDADTAATTTSLSGGGSDVVPAGEAIHGVSDATIEIGVLSFDVGIAEDTGEGLGADVDDPSEAAPDAIVQSVIDHVNANGGIAGRQIEPVYFFFDAAQYATPAGRQSEQQRACAFWTEDHEVFAFVASSMSEDVIFQCAADTGTVMVATGPQLALSESRFSEMADVWYSPHGLLADRRESAFARGVLDEGLLPSDATIGVMVEDRPSIREGVENGMIPVLEEAGLDPALEIAYPDYIESPWETYVLQMKEAGVTHILMSATAGDLWSTSNMMLAAEAQDYHPQWLIGSDNGPNNLKLVGAPTSQMMNTRGVGWSPANDVGATEAVSPAGETCQQLMTDAQQPPDAGNGICDALFFLQSAFDEATELSPSGLSEALAALGSGFESSTTIDGATSFASGKHDGVALVRAFEYDEGCPEEGAPCFRYLGEPIEIAADG